MLNATRRQQGAPLHQEDEGEQQERDRQREAQGHVEHRGGSGDDGDADGMGKIGPVDLRERRAAPRLCQEDEAERYHQRHDERREHAGAGRGQGAEGEIAADRQHQGASNNKDAPGHVVPSQGHRSSSPASGLRMKSAVATVA